MQELTYKKNNGYKVWDESKIGKAMDYAKGYMDFISTEKIEREVIRYATKVASENGFVEASFDGKFDKKKFYVINKNKSIALVKMGKDGLSNGVRIIIAHIDSPRLDLKPNPLYEDSDTAYFKTHYYGGIKKYQWMTIPLAMHGRIILNNGENIDVAIGEKDSDPVFYISDLLPHLSQEQAKLTLSEAFPAEKLNIIVGGMADKDVESDAFKYNVLRLLNSAYGIIEEDLLSAEIEFVPAGRARDIGLDRAYIGAYGHDDKICAYSGFTAFMDANDNNTDILYLVDKEEIGSDGVSGAQSSFIADIIEKLAEDYNVNYAALRQASKCISADVTAAFDSNYKDAFESSNSTYLSYGIAINKYTGARGKSGASDASAEYVNYIKNTFNDADVLWQIGELGRVDLGGGGTVAKYLANQNIDTIDVGVPVMSMHSPFELISKVDLYSAFEAYKSFFNK